jgi:hypothetical protein
MVKINHVTILIFSLKFLLLKNIHHNQKEKKVIIFMDLKEMKIWCKTIFFDNKLIRFVHFAMSYFFFLLFKNYNKHAMYMLRAPVIHKPKLSHIKFINHPHI